MNTVLGLLQEVEQAAGAKIDWREVAKNSATGISGAREYQMLWRHLAYGEALIDQVDNDAEPIVSKFFSFIGIFILFVAVIISIAIFRQSHASFTGCNSCYWLMCG